MTWPIAIIFAFFAGSIPFSWLLGLARGIDIRKHGSGNVGATNLGRILGRPWFFLGFALDAAKGFVPVFVAGQAMGVTGSFEMAPADAWLWLVTMLAAVLGHMYSPIVGFKGGKGVATGLGAVLGVFPALTVPGVGALAVFLTTLGMWRYVSVSSTVAAASLPAFAYVAFGYAKSFAQQRALDGVKATDILPETAEQVRAQATANIDPFPFVLVTLGIAILVAWKHRGNFERISQGLEPQMGSAKQAHERMPESEQDSQAPASSDSDSDRSS